MTQIEVGNMFWNWVKTAHPDIKRIAIVSRDDAAGQSIVKDLREILSAHGYEVVGTEFVAANTTDFYPVLTKVLALKPDALEISTPPPAAVGLIAKQTAELGWKGPLFATGEQAIGDTLKVGGAENVVGRYFAATSDYDSALATDGERSLAARYRKAYNDEPLTGTAVMGYNGLWILAQAIQGAGTLDSAALAKWLQSNPVESLAGPSRFSGRSIYGVDNQLYSPVWVSEAAAAGWKGIAKSPAAPPG
jgi:branched-chain amino acid transport system substrate-binding protein